MFYFLRILRLIHIKRFVARSFKEAVASLDGEVVPLSVDQLPSLDSIAVCIDVVSLLGVIRIAVRVQGYPFAFGPAVFVFDVEPPALIGFGPDGGYLLFHFLEEFGFLGEVIIELVKGQLLSKCLLAGEQVRSKTEAVTLDGSSETCDGGREHVHGGETSVFLLLRLDRRVDDHVVYGSGVVRINVLTEIGIHRQMVARNYDRCVLVEILLLNPGNELGDLLAGAVQNHSVLVVTVVFFIAELTRISILKMGVCGQHGEVERLSLCCDFGQAVFGK